MEIEFFNKEIEKLYLTGKSKKLKLTQQVIKKFFMRIQQIAAAETIHDLWRTPSINFEKLKGEYNYSIRIDKEYRLELNIDWENESKTKGKFFITEISKHYGD